MLTRRAFAKLSSAAALGGSGLATSGMLTKATAQSAAPPRGKMPSTGSTVITAPFLMR